MGTDSTAVRTVQTQFVFYSCKAMKLHSEEAHVYSCKQMKHHSQEAHAELKNICKLHLLQIFFKSA
jgi:hypothetical protein